MSLKLVLEVTSKLSGGNTEQIFDKIPCESNTLVCVVVLVVRFLIVESHFEDLTNDTSEEDCLFLSVFWLVTEVRKQFSVEELVHTGFSVLFLLSCSEFLLQPFICFTSVLDVVFTFLVFVSVDLVDVGNDELERLLGARNGSEYFLVSFDTERSHQQNNWNWGCSGSADLDHEHTISTLFNGERLAHTVLLRENLGDFCSLSSSLVDFNGDTVRSEIFH